MKTITLLLLAALMFGLAVWLFVWASEAETRGGSAPPAREMRHYDPDRTARNGVGWEGFE